MVTRLIAIQGNIAEQQADAIVNAAAPGLGGGTGVSRAIHAAAGPELFDAAQALEPLGRGNAAATQAFGLPARWVIHAIGPVWVTGQLGEERVLERCYRRSLEVAVELGARRIVFPAISTGAYRFPKDQAAKIAVATVRQAVHDYPDAFDTIIFCCHGADSLAAHEAALAESG